MSDPTPGRQQLTDRQLACLRHAADGLTAAETAKALHASRGVVTNELERIRQILGARNTTHAVALAYRAGILTTSEDA